MELFYNDKTYKSMDISYSAATQTMLTKYSPPLVLQCLQSQVLLNLVRVRH